jgi:pyochelin synthetase
MGGATEASIWSIDYPITAVNPEWKSIPYGRPMANQTYFVLNESLEPCPIGVPGDLYIGGIGLAEGYWRDAQKTAVSFVRHPRTRERLYRTGDLGRFMHDGNIEFLGRQDFQVKVNGYRIELGEIETSLEKHPNVAKAVANAIGDAQNGKQLVAYIIPRHEPAPTVEALQTFLAEKLPSYMVPLLYLRLDTLPLSSNGKVNRKALPMPSSAPGNTTRRFVAPTTPLEQLLAAIVAEVLHLEKAGVNDNFFELGANSLSVIQLVSRLRDILDVELSVPAIFEKPTVTGLKELIGTIDAQLQRAEETARLFVQLKAEVDTAA